MARVYQEMGLQEEVVCSLFARRLPPTRNFLLACGVEDLLETLRFGPKSLAWIRSLGEFPETFLDGVTDQVEEGCALC